MKYPRINQRPRQEIQSASYSGDALFSPGFASSPGPSTDRTRWILAHRGGRNAVSADRPYAFFVEEEAAEAGRTVRVATVFLTNRECPWRCLMCDLWKNTLADTVPAGAIPAQIDHALSQLPPADWIKLYNSGSFFDPRAIPPEDLPVIAGRVRRFQRVIVECHPVLVDESCVSFRDELQRPLEVAMGLETAHPEVLARLNKRMTLDQFARAAEYLRTRDIALRVFVLLRPPFLSEAEGVDWARRSIDFAFDCGAGVVAVIPTRTGNGALDELARMGEFTEPALESLEQVLDYGLQQQRGRVVADLWDLQRFARCPVCFSKRQERLHKMNLCQTRLPAIECPNCAHGS